MSATNKAKLIVSNQDQGVRTYEVADGSKINLGRELSNDIVVKDPRVSRIHASIYMRGQRLFVTDLFSRNGTVVNGEVIVGDKELFTHDVINLGATVITVELTDEAINPHGDDVTATGGFTHTKIAAVMFRCDKAFEQQIVDKIQAEATARGGQEIFEESNWVLYWWNGGSLGKMSLASVSAASEIAASLKAEVPDLQVFIFALSALLEGEEQQWKLNLMGDPFRICYEFNLLLKGYPAAILAERAIVSRVKPDWEFERLANLQFKDNPASIELYSLKEKVL